MDLIAALDVQLARLREGGVRAAADLADLNPPGVLLRPPTLTWRFKQGDYAAAWEAWVVTPDTGIRNSLATFAELLPKVQAALGWAGTEARPDVVAAGDSGTLPAYILTFTTRIPA